MSGTTPPRLRSGLVEAKGTEISPMSSAASVFRSSLAAAEWGLGDLVSLRLGEVVEMSLFGCATVLAINILPPTFCDRNWRYLGDFWPCLLPGRTL